VKEWYENGELKAELVGKIISEDELPY